MWHHTSRAKDYELSNDFPERRPAGSVGNVAVIGTRGYPSYYGGFETAVRQLAPYLSDAGWSVTVYGRDGATREDDPKRDPRVVTVETAGLEKKSLSTLTYGLTAVLDTIRRRPDVALVMNVANGFWLPLLTAFRIPTVVNVDGLEWERAKWGRLAKLVFKIGAKMTARFGNILVTDAKEIQRRWLQDFGRNSTFIPYGGEVVGDLPLEDGLTHRGYVLIVARFVPENTVSEFFDAAEQLAVKYRVVIVGASGYGGPLDERAKTLDARFDNVTWLGHIRDDARLFSLFQHAGAYFHGHSVGGTNPALVQAMACGAPVVARDTVYNREVLGDAALFCLPTASDIAAVVSAALDDAENSDKRGQQAKRRAGEEYSWSKVCGAYEEVLRASMSPATSRLAKR